MKDRVKIILTGLNGYGGNFVKELLKKDNEHFQFVAVVSGKPEKSQYYHELLEQDIKIYPTIEQCLEDIEVDLAIISTPMHIHYNEILCALKHGVHIYCEKPLVPTIDECLEIKKLAEEKSLIVSVGYQWSFAKATQDLKLDILKNKFGKIIKIKTMVRWYREKSYFANSDWKGRNIGANSKYILENLMSNAASHYLHNLLFLSGSELSSSVFPSSIEGECYKAHSIDSFDTVFLRIKTTDNIELQYYATIVSLEDKEPVFEIEFEHATAYYNSALDANILVKTQEGKVHKYGSPEENRFLHWLSVVDSIRNDKKVICDVTTVIPAIVTVNATIENIPVNPFTSSMIEENESRIWVTNIQEVIENCYREEKLPSELRFDWAKKATTVDTKDYKSFKGIA